MIKLIKYIIFTFFIFAIICPLVLHEMLSIYSEPLPQNINYQYWNYSFSVINLSLIIIGSAINPSYSLRLIKIIIIPLVVYNLIIGIIYGSSIYTDYHFHGLLILLTGISFAAISDYLVTSLQFHRFLTMLFACLFPTQIIRLILNQHTDGRFAMQGLGLGETALFTSVTILYLIFKPKPHNNDIILFIVASTSLLLTGQRSIMLVLVLFMIMCYLSTIINYFRNKGDKIGIARSATYQTVILISTVSSFAFLSLVYLTVFDFQSMNFLNRLFASIYSQSENVFSTATSSGGRLLSLVVGFQVIGDFPFGIGTDFYQLQLRMQERGYPTFPHNGMMNVYLMMSPIILIYLTLIILNIARHLRKQGLLVSCIPVYFLLVWSVWGGPFLNPLLFWIFLLFTSSTKYYQGQRC